MHLSMLIPGGKGAGNGWGFDCEFYPHRQAFENDFSPGAGDLLGNFSMKPRIEKTGSPETIIVYFCIRFCLFWHFGI